jgi:hypothetical protein
MAFNNVFNTKVPSNFLTEMQDLNNVQIDFDGLQQQCFLNTNVPPNSHGLQQRLQHKGTIKLRWLSTTMSSQYKCTFLNSVQLDFDGCNNYVFSTQMCHQTAMAFNNVFNTKVPPDRKIR